MYVCAIRGDYKDIVSEKGVNKIALFKDFHQELDTPQVTSFYTDYCPRNSLFFLKDFLGAVEEEFRCE